VKVLIGILAIVAIWVQAWLIIVLNDEVEVMRIEHLNHALHTQMLIAQCKQFEFELHKRNKFLGTI